MSKNSDEFTPMGQRIYLGMKAKGWTPSETARRASMDTATLHRWLNHPQKRPDAAKLRQLADALDLNAIWLRTGNGSPTPRVEVNPDLRRLVEAARRVSPMTLAKLIERAEMLAEDAPARTRSSSIW